ncbi:hypothetical protein B0H10DRAFT_2037486 [Mycena sp. CBHHK59/15]|nr:hypothetical protein B0H10DRAFT_2037486 [Mycena sp. CBHHK59/15]
MSISPPLRRLRLSTSSSPPPRRLSVSSQTRQEELINAYEAEEERIMNVLSKKLEQLREEKIALENVLEAEGEAQVNRLARELSSLRLLAGGLNNTNNTNNGSSNGNGNGNGSTTVGPANPSAELMLAALQRENEALRARVADTERDYLRISRLNEIYREELLEHRNRLGLPVEHLVGLASPDPYSQPTHHRPQSSFSSRSSMSSSPTNSVRHFPANGVPIPRPAAQVRRASGNINHNNVSEGNTPLSHSPASSPGSPFPFSPPASAMSAATSPPTSYTGFNTGAPARGLSYPSVPPPSLASSFGSPTVAYHMPHREPADPPSRRNSVRRGGARVAESGSLRSVSRSASASVERGARVAETGQLVPRDGRGRGLPATTEAPDSPPTGGIDILSLS